MNIETRFKEAVKLLPLLHIRDLEFIAQLVSLSPSLLKDIPTSKDRFVSAAVRDGICGAIGSCTPCNSRELKNLLKSPEEIMNIIESAIEDGDIPYTELYRQKEQHYMDWLTCVTGLEEENPLCCGYHIDRLVTGQDRALHIHFSDTISKIAEVELRVKEILKIAANYDGAIMIGLYTDNEETAIKRYGKLRRYIACCPLEISKKNNIFFGNHFYYVNTNTIWWT